MYAIEQGVPLPPTRRGRPRSTGLTANIDALQLAESFAIPKSDIGEGKRYKSIASALSSLRSAASNLEPKQFKVGRDDAGDPRIWRIDDQPE